jgi:acetyl-CoA carboxylase carboxyl transferase subunit beta
MGLFSRDKPKIKVQTIKRDGFSGWIKCTSCHELIHANELEQNSFCCPKCTYHYRFPVEKRIESLSDEGSYKELFNNFFPVDALGFVDKESYTARLKRAESEAESPEAIRVGSATLNGHSIALGVMDFSFMGGSMGSVVGEKLTLLIELALQKRWPLIVVSTSGGARMQESTLSLMQMAKISAALARFGKAHLPFISILTNPTTGGVTASFASLGDLILAEPQALICFAGPRVIEQTIGHKLPEEAQKSEFLLKHGMIDCIVPRSEMREKVSSLLGYFDLKECV